MPKQDNLDKIREVNSMLIYAVEIPNSPICSHPFTNSPITVREVNGQPAMVNLTDPNEFAKWADGLKSRFNNENLEHLYSDVQGPWKLTWLKFCKPYMSKDSFSEYLAQAWVEEENPNMDANVKIPMLIRWFKSANKQKLMTPEDYEYYMNLPDTITVYRGVSIGRNPKGLSWTDSLEKAEWFQHRFENWDRKRKGYLLKAVVPKEYALAYFNTRDEQEIVLDVKAAKDLIQRV